MSTHTAKYIGATSAVLLWFSLQIINGAVSRLANQGASPFATPLSTAAFSWAVFSVVAAIGLFAERRIFLSLTVISLISILLLEIVEAVSLAYTQPFFLSTLPQVTLQALLLYKLLSRKTRNEFAAPNASRTL